MTKLSLMTDVVQTMAGAVRLKHRITKRELRREVCKAVQRKQYAEIEAELAKAMEPLFRRQIESAAGRLGGLEKSANQKLKEWLCRYGYTADDAKKIADVYIESGINKVMAVVADWGEDWNTNFDEDLEEVINDWNLEKKTASDQAVAFAKLIFNPDEWYDELIDVAAPVLVRMMAEAAVATLLLVSVDVRKGGVKTYRCSSCGEMMAAYMPEISPQSVAGQLEPVCHKCSPPKNVSATGRKSTASEWLEGADQDVPLPEYFDTPAGPVSIGIATELPTWMQTGIAERLRESFAQPYWRKIHETTGRDIERILDHGLKEGLSIREMAKRITAHAGNRTLDEMAIAEGFGNFSDWTEQTGGSAANLRKKYDYPKRRALNIARTESGNALNGASEMSIEQLKEEMGPEAAQWVGKSWLSVLGNTTRDTHADADGQLADEEGMFTVGGYRVPYPSHYSLPPEEKCNCQCKQIMELGAGAPEEEIEAIMREQAEVLRQ